VLDHHGHVAERRDAAGHADEPRGVAGVQARGGLVEHHQRARERGAQRGGEGHALHLAAGERARRPVEREVPDAHVVEVPEARANLRAMRSVGSSMGPSVLQTRPQRGDGRGAAAEMESPHTR
jgi:hypothetical protein